MESLNPSASEPNLSQPPNEAIVPPFTPLVQNEPKKFPLLLAIAIPVLVVIAVITIYVMLQARTMYQESVVLASPSPTPQASTDPTSDWQFYTYKNLTFKYPHDWKLTTKSMVSIQPSYALDNEKFPAITFSVVDNPGNLSIKEYDEKVSREGKDPGLYSAFVGDKEKIAEEISIGDVKGYLLPDQNCEPLDCDKLSFVYDKNIYIIKNIFGYLKIAEYGAANENEDMKKVFSQLISTFKFESAYTNKELESVIKSVVYDNGKNLEIPNKDKIVVKIQKIDGDFAYGIARLEDSMEGAYSNWYAIYLDGHWTQIWAGQEPPSCDSLNQWQPPKNFFNCRN